MPSAANENDNEQEHAREKRGDQPKEPPAKSSHGAGPPFASPESTVQDLSSELMRELPRSPDEMVRCRRVVGNHYRCNWWAPRNTSRHDKSIGLITTRYQVIQSQMLRVTLSGEGLLIERGPRQ